MAIIDVVKWNGTPDILAWKYPSEELGTWTQLIVAESQEAWLIKSGQPVGPFLAGRHTLDTANYPVLGSVLNIATGRSPFTAEVWYVNKMISLDIKWGTSSPIQALDPKYKIMLPVRAYGQLGLQVQDTGKFLVKLVGTLSTFDRDRFNDYFRGVIVTRAKDAVAQYLGPATDGTAQLDVRVHPTLLPKGHPLAGVHGVNNAILVEGDPVGQVMFYGPGAGAGPTASAVVATVGDFRQFKDGAQFGAWLGLTPRQNSSGGKNSLGKITKRGDMYLRTLLIQGAKSIVQSAQKRDDPISKWALKIREKSGWQKAVVALANKNARILWAVFVRGKAFDANHVSVKPTGAMVQIDMAPA